jgi:hypothetical protein
VSMSYIRRTYGVPAKRGGRVRYTGGGKPELGTIRSAGAHLNVQPDGVQAVRPCHPRWKLEYL